MKDKERTYYVCTKLNEDRETGPRLLILGSLSIVGVGFVKIPPQFYEKGPFYV